MAKAKEKKTWIVVFVSCFLGLMVDNGFADVVLNNARFNG